MAISERYRKLHEECTQCAWNNHPEAHIRFDIEPRKLARIIEELSAAEEQLAEQKRVFEAYAAESKATIDARDREIAELRVKVADMQRKYEWSF